MNDSIKIEIRMNGGLELEHFQKLEFTPELFSRTLTVLAAIPAGNDTIVTVTKDGRPLVFGCSGLDKTALLKALNYKKRVRNASTETADDSL
jgi:hypothetical protein